MVQELYVWAFALFFFVSIFGAVLYLTLLGYRQDNPTPESDELEPADG